MTTLRTASHEAHLDHLAGVGLLILPLSRDDVPDPCSAHTLHSTDWGSMVRLLDSHGWEPMEGEDGDVMVDGVTEAGRTALALHCREPISDHFDPIAWASAFRELSDRAGLVE